MLGFDDSKDSGLLSGATNRRAWLRNSPFREKWVVAVALCAVVGFTCGPAIGALFAVLPSYRASWITVDQFTGPGLFLIVICAPQSLLGRCLATMLR